MASQVVKYRAGDTAVEFEVEPGPGYQQAGAGNLAKDLKIQVAEAVTPAVEAAKVVMDKIREARPHAVEVKFGVKASAEGNWVVAKTSAECSFEITMAWTRDGESESQDQELA